MDVATSTREQVRTKLEKGMTVRDIALVLHITTQAVYKHKKALAAEAEAEEVAS